MEVASRMSDLPPLSDSSARHLDADMMQSKLDYQRVDPLRKEIRLLRLQKVNGDDLDYTMSHMSLNGQINYCALSYYWGAPVRTSSLREIKVNGTVVQIRPTLYNFLRILAIYFPQTIFWTDVICINQNDIEERNDQVSMMGDIYRSANTVYAWLGEGNADSDYAFDYVCGEESDIQYEQRIFSQCCEGLLSLAYWTRMWVVQEFALAQKLFLVCGSKIAEWQRFDQKLGNIKEYESDEVRNRLQSFRRVRESSSKKLLIELILDFYKNRCIDKLDKVYSLRSLAEDGDLITVDYTQSIGDVFFRLLSLYHPMAASGPRNLKGQVFEIRTWGALEFAKILLRCLRLLPQDIFANIRTSETDRLFHWVHSRSFVNSVYRPYNEDPSLEFPSLQFCANQPGSPPWHFYSGDEVKVGDDIFSLTHRDGKPTDPRMQTYGDIFLVMRFDEISYSIVDIAMDDTLMSDAVKCPWKNKRNQLLRYVCLHGMEVCCACTSRFRDIYSITLVHISRAVIFLFINIDELLNEQSCDGKLNCLLIEIAHQLSEDHGSSPRQLCPCKEGKIVDWQPRKREAPAYLTVDDSQMVSFPFDEEYRGRVYDRIPESRGYGYWPALGKDGSTPLIGAAEVAS